MRLNLRALLSSLPACGVAAALAVVAAPAARAAEVATAPDPAALEFFEKKVRPLLVDNCYNCHSAATNAKGGLRVDDRNGLLAGGNNGAAVVPGQPDKGLLLKAVSYEHDDLQMPPKKRLSPEQVADLRQWVADGAAWPQAHAAASVVSDKPNERYERLKREHWAWQPLSEAKPPAVRDAAWPRDDVDRFVLAKLEEKGLSPVGDADRLTLIRRVTFDLTGLPPTPEEVDAFLSDSSADAFARVVDRLLASPAFGERWGRHWLDVARYGESTGSSRNVPYPHAWRYRDYVVDAFNADKPYDQFVREQVAGDLLPAESPARRDEQLVATGFLALGVKDVNQRFKVRFVMDNVDEQIDTVTRSVLALTASCARCHDHKFDPIPQSEYYALAGIFRSTDLCAGVRNKMGGGGLDYYDPGLLIPLGERKESAVPPEKLQQLRAEVEKARAEFQAIRGTPRGTERGPDGFPRQRAFRLKFEKLQAEFNALTDPAASGPVALGARDAQSMADTEIRIRGEAEKLGPVVPRGFLGVVQYPGQPAVNAAQSGRLELAEWLTSPRNPLTSRVAVNRVWHHLFGRGIVASVDNFGVTGDVPSHPELLDHLARRFVAEDWSVKRLVRAVVLSRTYQLASAESPAAAAADPAGRLLWRHNPRRLTAEEIRDATLAASGHLVTSRPGAAHVSGLPVVEQRNNGPEAVRFQTLAADSLHRSLYLPLIRGWTPVALEVFDFAEQGMVTGSRETTTVAPQALYMLNDPFVRRQSLALAERVLREPDLKDDAARVDRAYRLALGRPPSGQEVARAVAYVGAYEATAREVVAAAPATRPAATAEPAAAAAAAPAGKAKGKRKAQPDATPDVAAAAASASAVPAPAPAPAPPPQPINPDEMDQTDTRVQEAAVQAADARTAAWASFCQALIGSAEFRYLR